MKLIITLKKLLLKIQFVLSEQTNKQTKNYSSLFKYFLLEQPQKQRNKIISKIMAPVCIMSRVFVFNSYETDFCSQSVHGSQSSSSFTFLFFDRPIKCRMSDISYPRLSIEGKSFKTQHSEKRGSDVGELALYFLFSVLVIFNSRCF